MPILIDTNILLRSVQPSHPMHAGAVRALEVLMKREEALAVALQNVAEFWNAATRPAINNGLGFTIEECSVIRHLEDAFDSEPRERRSGP
jgi:predicted nucleic acid-binding protein